MWYNPLKVCSHITKDEAKAVKAPSQHSSRMRTARLATVHERVYVWGVGTHPWVLTPKYPLSKYLSLEYPPHGTHPLSTHPRVPTPGYSPFSLYPQQGTHPCVPTPLDILTPLSTHTPPDILAPHEYQSPEGIWRNQAYTPGVWTDTCLWKHCLPTNRWKEAKMASNFCVFLREWHCWMRIVWQQFVSIIAFAFAVPHSMWISLNSLYCNNTFIL